jgi:antigen flippase
LISSIIGRTRWLVRGRTATAAVMQTTLSQIVTLVANLATGILTARLLAPTGRGELAAINLIPALMGFLMSLGIPAALLYHLKRDREHAANLTGAALVVICGLGLIGMIVGYALMPFALHQYSPYVVTLARVFLFTVPLSLFTYVTTSVFESAGDFWYGSGTRFLSPLVTLVSLLAFWAAGRLDVLTAATSYAIPALPIGIKMLIDVVRRYKPVFLPAHRQSYADLFSYGFRSFGTDLLRTIGQQIDQLLVITFLSPAAMGLYAVALAVSRILQIFQSSVVRVLLPRIAAKPPDEVVTAVGYAARVTATLTFPLCAGVALLAPLLLRLTYGGKFTGASDVLRVLAVEALFAGSTWILAQAFLASGRPGIVTALQGIGLALSFPLMLVLIPRFGLLGAGIALLLSTLTRFVLVLVCFPWLLKMPPPSLFATRAELAGLRRKLSRVREAMP